MRATQRDGGPTRAATNTLEFLHVGGGHVWNSVVGGLARRLQEACRPERGPVCGYADLRQDPDRQDHHAGGRAVGLHRQRDPVMANKARAKAGPSWLDRRLEQTGADCCTYAVTPGVVAYSNSTVLARF